MKYMGNYHSSSTLRLYHDYRSYACEIPIKIDNKIRFLHEIKGNIIIPHLHYEYIHDYRSSVCEIPIKIDNKIRYLHEIYGKCYHSSPTLRLNA